MIGIDIVEIQRIEKLLEKYPQKALKRFLSDDEIVLAKSIQSIAGFYAAKEAISKALGTGICEKCTFKDIRIHKDTKGAPYFTLSSHIVEEFHITECSLSITHDGGFAIAVAVITSTNRPKPNPICH